jgi:hypothetical protein
MAFQHIVAHAKPVHHTGAEVLHHHIGRLHQPKEQRALPASCLRFTVTDFLPAFCARKRHPHALRAFRSGSAPSCRARSPRPAASTLMTSAPICASWWQQNGPASTLVRSRTLSPDTATPPAPRGVRRLRGDEPRSSPRIRKPCSAPTGAGPVGSRVHDRRAAGDPICPGTGRTRGGRSPPGGGKRPGQSAAQRPGLQ